ncbi:hypothetical protein J22TS3_49950 [Paenibacillus sp. J22TS3]|nr:hypothetical protein J22TS3_49950 [Paenibacillus sp. J22TS3]
MNPAQALDLPVEVPAQAVNQAAVQVEVQAEDREAAWELKCFLLPKQRIRCALP